MKTIDNDSLRCVIGGAGFMDALGPILQNAGPILQGVSGIIAASKGGGGGAAQAAAEPQAAAAPAEDPNAAAAAVQQAAAPAMGGHRHRSVSVTVGSF